MSWNAERTPEWSLEDALHQSTRLGSHMSEQSGFPKQIGNIGPNYVTTRYHNGFLGLCLTNLVSAVLVDLGRLD